MKRFCLLILLLIYSDISFAQDKFTISGHVRDESTGEELIGTSIYIEELKTGSSSNVYGFYSLTIPTGDYTVRYSNVGYITEKISITLSDNITKNIELKVKPIVLKSTSVTAKAADENITQIEMGTIKLKPETIKDIPVIFGEQDIMKTVQLMPGVKSLNEGSSGFSVRGGKSDQNLILLDEAIVYNTTHFLGFFSVFNSDAIKDVKLIKGTASSEYGGRLSSVLDMKMNEGNIKKFDASGGIGLISSRLTLQAPIVKNKGSFILSGRRTYFDVFMKLSKDEEIKNSAMYFYDLNIKTNYRLGNNDRIFLSGYLGRDVFEFNDEFGISWGNKTATLRWNHIFNNKIFLNSSLIFSKYDYVVSLDFADELIDIRSLIKDYNIKEDFQYFINPKHAVKFGLNVLYHDFLPGKLSATEESTVNEKTIKNKYALENAVYINHEFDATSQLTINYGLRYSGFGVYGPGVVYKYNSEGIPLDSTNYDGSDLIKYYGGFEPRISFNYILTESSSTKISYARNKQYLHLLSISTSTTPFDLWHPSTSIIKPGISDQVAIGYFRNFEENNIEASVEVYYKEMKNLVDYKNGANIFLNEFVESELVFGKGKSYGAEFLVSKRSGKLTGWFGYTLSRTRNKFDAIDNGAAFPARQDRTHEVSLVGMYDLSNSWKLSGTWVYHTGNAVTFPSGKYKVDDHIVNLYTERNGYRMPAYHRLDLSLTLKGDGWSWNFSLYNAYGRRNAYSIYFRKNEADLSKTEVVRMSLFSFFPSLTYNFTW